MPAQKLREQHIALVQEGKIFDVLTRVCETDPRSTGTKYWSLNLVITRRDGSPNAVEEYCEFPSSPATQPERPAPYSFLATCIKSLKETQEQAVLKFIFTRQNGYVIQSDFLERRLECCEQVSRVQTFLPPGHRTSGIAGNHLTTESFVKTLSTAVGGIHVQIEAAGVEAALDGLDRELENRLSYPWLLGNPITRKRIFWIQGREEFDAIRRAYESALALGISLVILDVAGHWLEDPNGPYAYLREAFIPTSVDPDAGLAQRIVDAVRRYPHQVDGVVTISDVRLTGVAKACKILGLPTSPPTAYEIAGDKAKTRILEPNASETFTLSAPRELMEHIQRQDKPLEYPLIVKPCLGWNSDCVAKVSHEAELVEAVKKASKRHAFSPQPNTAVIVERYIDGPEVDANFVLLDGEILFFDINDDFPSEGDKENAGLLDNFQETQNVMPSALPKEELEAIRDSLHKSILRQGFTSGVFHCEARLRNSRVGYTQQGDIVELETKQKLSTGQLEVYLIENNARPPGYLETVAVMLTYGVNYYAIRLLLALGPSENERIRALCQPFKNGPQFHLSLMIIPNTKSGVMRTADAGSEFLAQHPELRKQIPDYRTQLKGGQIVENTAASSLWWVAYFSVVSRTSRNDLLHTVKFVHENFTYDLE